MITVEKACCCLTLRTGNILIGWLGMMFYIATSVCLATFVSAVEDDHWFAVLVVLTVISFVHVLNCLGIIIGTLKHIPQLLVPWMTVEIAIMIIFKIFAIFACFDDSLSIIITTVVIVLLFNAFNIYLVICVYSMYRKIRDIRQHQAYGK